MRLVPMSADDWHPHVTVEVPDYVGLLTWAQGFVAAPLSGDALLLRGILPPFDGREGPRIVLWDGHDPRSSVAFDIATTDDRGAPIPPPVHIRVLRRLAEDHLEGRSAAPVARDGFGVPVHDVRQRSRDLANTCRPTIADALARPLHGLTSGAGPEPEDCALWGFVLADEDTGRYYVRVPGEQEGVELMVGVDLRLRGPDGEVLHELGLLDVYLPSLAYDRDLPRFRSADGDGYCDMVCDVTEFVR